MMNLSLTFCTFLLFIGSIANAQNVGIGNPAPAGKLHIKGSSDVSQLIIDAHTTQSNLFPLIRLRKSSGTDLLWINADTSLNTFVGLFAGRVNNANGGGVFNTYNGSHAGFSSTTGNSNSGFGANSLFLNTTGSFNSAHGLNTLFSNASGSWNTAIGANALFSNTSGSSNTAVGNTALLSNINGSSNTSIGTDAMKQNSSGSNNTASGYKALLNNTTGMNNTAIGNETLNTITTGSNNTALGQGANVSSAAITNATAIGAKAYSGSSNSVVIGSINGVNGATTSANVGIGTSTPHSQAILELKSTNQGILFPRLTSLQRNAITNPPDGLHLFNTNERCLNYYDSLYRVWDCYCLEDTCNVTTIRITANTCAINFQTQYAVNYPTTKKFAVLIEPGVVISGCGGAAIDFNSMTSPASINIINHGTIKGQGGGGGQGAAGESGSCSVPAGNGFVGGNAILTKAGVRVTIHNYSIVASGGGGGGGGGRNVPGEYGGGGGGGGGIAFGSGGGGGGNTIAGPFGACLVINIAGSGVNGTSSNGGNGGLGANGGGNGGGGGNIGMQGQNGTGTSAGLGGAPGKAISGGSGNQIINYGSGQSFGTVD